MSANRFDGELVYAPSIIDDDLLDSCRGVIESFNKRDSRIHTGALIEVCETLCKAVDKLQSIDYVLALRNVITAHLATHANFPIQGSKRQEDMLAKKPRVEWRACDCDLCVDGRRALAGGPR